MSLIVLGTLALDTVNTPYGSRRDMLGGSAAHFAMSARLFTPVHLAAVIGADFPKKDIDFLRKKGIILASVQKSSGRSFRWVGEYRGDLNTAKTLNTELGVLRDFKPCVAKSEKNIENIFLANTDPDIQMDLLKQMRYPRLVALDSMNYWINNKKRSLLKILKKADIYLANEGEARELSGENNLLNAARFLRKLGPSMIVIKKGEHGVLFYSDKFLFSLPAYPVTKIADPTGAGDTFAGGFMGHISRCRNAKPQDIKRAIAYGTVCGSFNVEGFGLEKTSHLAMRDLNCRMREFKKVISF